MSTCNASSETRKRPLLLCYDCSPDSIEAIDPDKGLPFAYVMNNQNYHFFDDPRDRRCAMPSTALSGGSPAEAERLC